MKIISGERASGKTTMLIQMAHNTGARIVCQSQTEARFVEKRAEEMGSEIKKPAFDFGVPRPFNPETFKGETLLIDDAEGIIGKALAAYFGAPVDAITINKPNVLKSVISDEARDVMKKNLGEQYKEELQG